MICFWFRQSLTLIGLYNGKKYQCMVECGLGQPLGRFSECVISYCEARRVHFGASWLVYLVGTLPPPAGAFDSAMSVDQSRSILVGTSPPVPFYNFKNDILSSLIWRKRSPCAVQGTRATSSVALLSTHVN